MYAFMCVCNLKLFRIIFSQDVSVYDAYSQMHFPQPLCFSSRIYILVFL